jgi:hypothetical protein
MENLWEKYKFTILPRHYHNTQVFTEMPRHLRKCQNYDITANIYTCQSGSKNVNVSLLLHYQMPVVEWFVTETLSMRVRVEITKFHEHLQ